MAEAPLEPPRAPHLEPPWPAPQPYTPNVLRRLARGWRSWFGLLNEWDFRVALGELNLLGLPVFLVNEPSLVRRVLVEEVDAFPKHPYTQWILEPLIGRAIFSVNGEEWARQRRLVDQAFQAAQLQRVFPAMAEATEALLQRLEGGDTPIDIDAAMTQVTADVIVRTILSRPLAQGEAGEVFAAFARYQRRAARALVLRFLHLPAGLVQRSLRRDARVIRAWLEQAIAERLEAPAAAPANDLLACLIAARDPQGGGGFSPEELLDQVCFLFLAGHETSASALGMAAWLLALAPDAQERLRQEVRAVAGSAPLQPEHLRQLSYGAAVFNETLRLYPPVSFFIRERQGTATELAAAGRLSRCPVGALLTLSPWVIQRHEHHWPDPQGFRPERFLEQQKPEPFLPFGLGPRKCPGAAFAQQEALLVLAELVRRYALLPVPEQPPELVGRLTLRARTGLWLRLKGLVRT